MDLSCTKWDWRVGEGKKESTFVSGAIMTRRNIKNLFNEILMVVKINDAERLEVKTEKWE